MSILTRVKQFIFGSTGATSPNFTQIGSPITGIPVYSKDLTVIQALSSYLAGLQEITNSNAPYLEDHNSLYYLITAQIAYLMQNGVPEYESTTDYFNLISFVQVNGVLYQSINGTSGSPNNGNAPASSPTFWRNVDPYTTNAGLAAEIARAIAAEALLAPLASPTFTGHVTVPTPTNTTDAVTKAYADGLASGANPMVQQTIEEAGLTFDITDNYQLDKATICNAHYVGQTIESDIPLPQVTYPNARSTANPGYSRYSPLIARNADKTITTTQSLTLVTALRAFKASVLGTNSFTATVSGVTLTFANTTTNNAMISAIIAHALVRRWFSSGQNANFAALGGDFTGMTATIAGVEYLLTAGSVGSHTLTVSGSPPSGSQTIEFFPNRIQGSSTSIFLPRLSGFVSVGSDDDDGVEVGGYLHMDGFQFHWHFVALGNGGSDISITATSIGIGNQANLNPAAVKLPTDDGTDGPPRGGKNTSPRSVAKFQYTHAGVLLAAA